MNKQKEVQPDTMGQQNAPQKKKNIKTTLRNLLVLVLVAAVSIVGTLAFLADNSEKEVNTFTGSAGIDVTLTEDAWTADRTDSIVQGEEMADSYTPEMIIPKDPTLTNTSIETCDIWVAMRVDYTYDDDGDSTTAKRALTRTELENKIIEKLAIKDNNAASTGYDWIKLNTIENGSSTKYDIYLYKTTLANATTDDEGNVTPKATLFDKVQIKKQSVLDADDSDAYYTVTSDGKTAKKYKEFDITLYGAAIKDDASIPASLSDIVLSDVASEEIDMDDLEDLLTEAQEADDPNYSYIIALSLAKLLKTLPNN